MAKRWNPKMGRPVKAAGMVAGPGRVGGVMVRPSVRTAADLRAGMVRGTVGNISRPTPLPKHHRPVMPRQVAAAVAAGQAVEVEEHNGGPSEAEYPLLEALAREVGIDDPALLLGSWQRSLVFIRDVTRELEPIQWTKTYWDPTLNAGAGEETSADGNSITLDGDPNDYVIFSADSDGSGGQDFRDYWSGNLTITVDAAGAGDGSAQLTITGLSSKPIVIELEEGTNRIPYFDFFGDVELRIDAAGASATNPVTVRINANGGLPSFSEMLG